MTYSINPFVEYSRYGANNLNVTVYYDKVFKKEYLPSRIRYNQFFFYSLAFYFLYTVHNKVSQTHTHTHVSIYSSIYRRKITYLII